MLKRQNQLCKRLRQIFALTLTTIAHLTGDESVCQRDCRNAILQFGFHLSTEGGGAGCPCLAALARHGVFVSGTHTKSRDSLTTLHDFHRSKVRTSWTKDSSLQ